MNRKIETLKSNKNTYIYKVAGGCSLSADVYLSKTSNSKGNPTLIWLHPGSLIFGNRENLATEQADFYTAAGYNVVSIDYRLAPETHLQEIIDDVQDAYTWVCNEGPKLFFASPNKVAVIGHSAGGFLAQIIGSLCKKTPPKAIVSFYGYCELTWYNTPSSYYIREFSISESSTQSSLGKSPISGSVFQGFSDPRFLYYVQTRKQGDWLRKVGGPTITDNMEKFCPLKQVTNQYPPTVLLHGTTDQDVPITQAKLMAAALESKGVEHEFIQLQGLGHMFEKIHVTVDGENLVGLKNPKVQEAFASVIKFLDTHVQ